MPDGHGRSLARLQRRLGRSALWCAKITGMWIRAAFLRDVRAEHWLAQKTSPSAESTRGKH